MNFFNNNNRHMQYTSMAEGFMPKVYGWMCTGLALTAGVAYYLSPEVNPALFTKLMGLPLLGLMLVQIGLVFYFSSQWRTMSYGAAAGTFALYSLLSGVTIAPVLYMYTAVSVFYVFGIAASMFAVMALYGWMTKTDLSSLHNILLMGLIGLIVAHVINIFFASQTFSLVTASIGVGIFSLLTAYDIQSLKYLSQQTVGTREDMNKLALLGALKLYLDLVNLFLYLLRLFGQQRRR